MDTTKLKELGLNKAAQKIDEMRELKRKMEIAYNKYRFVSAEQIEKFNDKLKEETKEENKKSYTFKSLDFTPIQDYEDIPPEAVLNKLERAIEHGCFDSFEVCRVEEVVVMKDPIIFGRIRGCTDRFFIAQWDDDITVEDIFLNDISNINK